MILLPPRAARPGSLLLNPQVQIQPSRQSHLAPPFTRDRYIFKKKPNMLAMLMQPETAGVHRSAARKKEKGEAEANAKVGGGGEEKRKVPTDAQRE